MSSNPGPRVIIVDDRDDGIIYSRGWSHDDDSKGQDIVDVHLASGFAPTYQHTVQLTQSNSSFSYEFDGTAISVVGATVSNLGASNDPDPGPFSWTCAVDGKSIDVSPERDDRFIYVLCSTKNLADARHVLTVNVTSRTSSFWLDSIQYVPSKNSPALANAVMLIDDSDPDIKHDSGWNGPAPGDFYNTTSTKIPGSSISFNFTGKGISWVAVMSAETTFDPSFVPSTGTYIVDSEEPVSFNLTPVVNANPWGQVIFETPELKPGTHTLKVTYNGNSTFRSDNTNSSSLEPIGLSLDYFLVTNAPVSSPTPSQTSPPQSPSNPIGVGAQDRGSNKLKGAAVGGIIGGVVLCLLLGIGFVLWRRKVRRRHQTRRDLASAEQLAASMYTDDPHGVQPFIVTSAMREAPSLQKRDPITDKLLAREALEPVSTTQSESSSSAALATNTSSTRSSSSNQRSGATNSASRLVQHEDSGIRLQQDVEDIEEVVEVPPQYTER